MQSFPAIFQEVDRLEKEGDNYVSEAIVVGLLEDLQNTNFAQKIYDAENFGVFCRQIAKSGWDKVYGFWEHGEIIAEDAE